MESICPFVCLIDDVLLEFRFSILFEDPDFDIGPFLFNIFYQSAQ